MCAECRYLFFPVIHRSFLFPIATILFLNEIHEVCKHQRNPECKMEPNSSDVFFDPYVLLRHSASISRAHRKAKVSPYVVILHNFSLTTSTMSQTSSYVCDTLPAARLATASDVHTPDLDDDETVSIDFDPPVIQEESVDVPAQNEPETDNAQGPPPRKLCVRHQRMADEGTNLKLQEVRALHQFADSTLTIYVCSPWMLFQSKKESKSTLSGLPFRLPPIHDELSSSKAY